MYSYFLIVAICLTVFGIAYTFFTYRNKERLALIESGLDLSYFKKTIHRQNNFLLAFGIIFIGFSVTWMLTGRLVATIYDTSIKDELTQLYNRRALEELLPKEIARSSRHKQPLSVLLLDIDHFKKVNDTYGHQAGDRVLRTTGKLLILQTRKDDLSFRYGGEEFLVLLPNTDVEKAVIVAEKLREAIKRARMLPTNVDSCTASFGVTQFNGEDDWQTAIERADQALYSAKENGRNQVTART